MREIKFIENYIPGSISFADGFSGPKGDVGFTMTLDRKKAKKIVKQLVKEGLEVNSAQVGLDGDWDINSEFIYENGKFLESTDIWESSVWAKPIMIINFNDSPSRTYEVWTKT